MNCVFANGYDLDEHVAELYDAQESYTEDVALLRRLIEDMGPLSILEPFCGTGRITLPLARDGHTVVGLDQSGVMLARAVERLTREDRRVRARVSLRRMDVTREVWPEGYDLVVLGGNCMYELATPEAQAGVIAAGAKALRPGGWLFLDCDHLEGALPRSWRQSSGPAFPSGCCADGAELDSTCATILCDPKTRLVRFLRRTRIRWPDGRLAERVYVQQKHPVRTQELERWLEGAGLEIRARYGSWDGTPYALAAPRAVLWARRPDA